MNKASAKAANENLLSQGGGIDVDNWSSSASLHTLLERMAISLFQKCKIFWFIEIGISGLGMGRYWYRYRKYRHIGTFSVLAVSATKKKEPQLSRMGSIGNIGISAKLWYRPIPKLDPPSDTPHSHKL